MYMFMYCMCVLIYLQMQIKIKQNLPQPSSLHVNTGYPIYYKGNVALLERVDLQFGAYLTYPKPIKLTVPFTIYNEKNDQMQPLMNVQIIDDQIREMIMKGKYQLKSQFFYIYFPSSVRVDEKIYKIHTKKFENLVDEVPKQYKNSFARLLVWEQGIGQHSIKTQQYKLNQSLSNSAKIMLQKKMNAIKNDIQYHQSQAPSSKSLMYIFMLKNKLAIIFQQLNITESALQLYKEIWYQMMTNFRCLLKIKDKYKMGEKLAQPNDIPKSPFVFYSMKDVLGYFQRSDSSSYLRIVCFAFMKLYTLQIITFKHVQGYVQLKMFVQYVLNNVLVWIKKQEWTTNTMSLYDISRNIWVIQVISMALEISQTVKKPPLVTKQQEFHLTYINLCSKLRGAVEKVGFIVYKIKNSSIVPSTINEQIRFFIMNLLKSSSIAIDTSIENVQGMQIQKKQLQLNKIIQQNLKLSHKTKMILINMHYFSHIYLQTLYRMYLSLKKSVMYRRLGTSLKLTYCKAVMMLGSQNTIQDFIPDIQAEWKQFNIVEQLHKTYFLIKQDKEEQVKEQITYLITNSVLNKCKQWVNFYNYVREHHYKNIHIGNIHNIIIHKQQQGNAYTFKLQLSNDRYNNINRQNTTIQLQIQTVTGKQQINNIQISNILFNKHIVSGTLNTQALSNSALVFRVKSLLLLQQGIQFEYMIKKQINVCHKINTQIVCACDEYRLYYGIWTPLQINITNITNTNNHIQYINVDEEIVQVSPQFQYTPQSSSSMLKLLLKIQHKQEEQLLQINMRIGFKSQDVSYQLRQTLNIKIQQLFTIKYAHIHNIQQYSIRNNSHIQLCIKQQAQSQTQEDDGIWQLKPQEEVYINTHLINVYPIQLQNLGIQMNLHDHCKYQKYDNNISTFKLSLLNSTNTNAKYGPFKKIQICSEQCGEVSIKSIGQGYELVGKVKGRVQFLDEHGLINLWILPLRKGNLLLPSLQINGKRGVWRETLIIQI